MDKIKERKASYKRYERLRTKCGIKSDYRVAKETGIAGATLCNWSKGKYEPKIDKKMKIAKCLGISLEELVGVV